MDNEAKANIDISAHTDEFLPADGRMEQFIPAWSEPYKMKNDPTQFTPRTAQGGRENMRLMNTRERLSHGLPINPYHHQLMVENKVKSRKDPPPEPVFRSDGTVDPRKLTTEQYMHLRDTNPQALGLDRRTIERARQK